MSVKGETGVLFMGAKHDVARRLPSDITVEPLNERLMEICHEVAGETKARIRNGFESSGRPSKE